MPEKSGLPSGVRGAAAHMLGFPSPVLGTPAVGYFNHWAQAVPGRLMVGPNTTALINAGRTIDLCMQVRYLTSHSTRICVVSRAKHFCGAQPCLTWLRLAGTITEMQSTSVRAQG